MHVEVHHETAEVVEKKQEYKFIGNTTKTTRTYELLTEVSVVLNSGRVAFGHLTIPFMSRAAAEQTVELLKGQQEATANVE